MEEERYSCEKLVAKSIKSSPLIQLMISVLDKSGCPFSYDRHISCEPCKKGLAGGYDRKYNQIVICQNYCQDVEIVRRTLMHELIHMYDHCSSTIDFNNIDHLACTEIRAANLADCKSPVSSFINGNFRHTDCVKDRAVRSVRIIAGVSDNIACQAVQNVFQRCYSDLEPVGRRCFNTEQENNALNQFIKLSKQPP